MLHESLYKLQFLRKELNKFNFIYYEPDGKFPIGFRIEGSSPSIKVDFQNFSFIKNFDNPFLRIFLKDIEEDYSKNISIYLTSINNLKRINMEYPITLGIWGLCPVEKVKALIFEYLRSEKIKVLGAQHGGLYAETLNMQFDTDFNRCDYFISYGFTQEDIEILSPASQLNTKIMPYSFSKSRRLPGKKKIDILFPITNSISMCKGGMLRISPDALTDRQLKLLEYLNTLQGFTVYIKPFMYSTYENCSVLPVLKRLNNIKVVDSMTLSKFIEKYDPKAVILEFPSTTLYEVLPLEAEIFFMGDPVFPWGENALEELQRRVYYSENIDDMISKIDSFLKGKLDKKRDDTFYRHYVYKEDSENNILRLIDDLVEGNI